LRMGERRLDDRLISEIQQHLHNRDNVVLSGLSGSGKGFFLQHFSKAFQGKCLCLVPGEEKAYDLRAQLRAFTADEHIFMFLGRNFVFLKENYSQVEGSRVSTLQECLNHHRRSGFIISTPAAFLHYLMSPQEMLDSTIRIQNGRDYPREQLLQQMVESGYRRVGAVSQPGDFTVKGGIVDVYPLGAKTPYRLEFFGDMVESIRRFGIDTQRSAGHEKQVCIPPADEISGSLQATLFDYLPKEVAVFVDEPREFMKAYQKTVQGYRETLREARRQTRAVRELPLLGSEVLRSLLTTRPAVYHSFFSGNSPQVSTALIHHIVQQDMEPFYGDESKLLTRLKEWHEKGYQIMLAVKTRPIRDKLQVLLDDHNLPRPEFIDNPVGSGFISSDFKVALLTEKDIWGRVKPHSRSRKGKKDPERILLEELQIGDYIVHEHYGIGIFRGITQLEQHGVTREYILLQYAGTDRLYLTVDKLDVLYKYHAPEDKNPRLSKLGGTEWERTKARVAKSIQEMAEELLGLYANRQAREGYAFSADTPWQQQFEDDFIYQETRDQVRAIQDVKRDMESRRPMDRLICGDVGYGKTEVAMRAAFKAVMDGKQVAVLVPTTVLAEQHHSTFLERFKSFPAEIEVLSRFKSPAEQKRIIADIKKGLVDIVIGTHRLLSKDISYKDLGLLIVDEEHRFGVAQKEKIKLLKEMVDVLSLSATPIPRSLHMSLTGLRDLSIIETPPPGRYPITTYVMEYRDDIIEEAIRAELERNGQVFFVHNRIEGIYRVQKRLQDMLPRVRIAVGHGRMPEDELAIVMRDFIKGEYQVLLCTTIIESGLDMPNVNTIIVDEADKMGLAQLYQLRGRVGRSHRIAYAYLTYQPDRILNENAQKRLNAIREFNELGAGMKIALRDLEIRGAGNILGPEQHGYIQAVGFDMYCRLLEQETARLRGKPVVQKGGPLVDVDIDYYIPDAYIPDPGVKIRVYRRLLLATCAEEIEEMRAELNDRFGQPPRPVENFLQITLLRLMARDKEIKTLRRKGKQIEIQLEKALPADVQQNLGGYQIRKLNPHTLLVQPEGDALQTLQRVLQMI
jgi:transcription-repair coupling factor (superfamily II helicase)